MTTVNLNSVEDLKRVWTELGHRIDAAMRRAAKTAAWYGAAQATKNTTMLGAVASHTFQRGWLSMPLRDGAIVSNKAEHSYFAEVGRKPGKAPPVSALVEWLKLKGVKPAGRVRPPKIVGEVSSAKQRARMRKAIRARAKYDREANLRGMAFPIARRIARRGTTGYRILESLLPNIARRWQRETHRQLDRITRDPPR